MFFDEVFIPLVVIVFIIFGVLVGVNSLQDTSCNKRWRDSGMHSKYSFQMGCMIEVKKGEWIPANNYRTLD